ncbi:hypothetical protein ACJJTC_015521 [Scirpophaga incertulas]
MWKKTLCAVICWLTFSETIGAGEKTVISSIVKDNDSAESAPRLYRNVPVGIYASAAPYAAYSFHIPAFVAAPKTAASRIIPVRELFLQNTNGHLRDSYGNKFFGAPHAAAYKSAFSQQQFLPLQELPAHLAQPLLAAGPQAKPTSAHYFSGSHYRLPTFQVAAQSPGNNFAGLSQALVHAENVKNFAPQPSLHTQVHGTPAAQQQPSTYQAVYTDAHVMKNGPKFQRLEYRPEIHYNNAVNNEASRPNEDKAQIQAAAAKTAVTAIVNGKKTIINLDTDPPVPLLDLSLLEPLTFENPLVPQVQHFLPRINTATYHKLPEFDVNQHVQKTHNDEQSNGKSHKGQKHPELNENHKEVPVKPSVTVKETTNDEPELVYEINSPNYKETYKEKSISYNKETESDPVSYSYDKKSETQPVHYSYQKTEQKEPITYSFVHNSNKPPAQIAQEPRQLIYNFQNDKPHNSAQSDDSGSSEDTGSSEDDRPSDDENSSGEVHSEAPAQQRNQNLHHDRRHEATQEESHDLKNDKPEHREVVYHHRPNEDFYRASSEDFRDQPKEQYHRSDKQYSESPNAELQHRPKEDHYHHNQNSEHHPRASDDYHPRKNEEIRHNMQNHKSQNFVSPHSAPVKQSESQYQLHTPHEYEEDIRLVPIKQSDTIKVDPAQHVQQTNPTREQVKLQNKFIQEQKVSPHIAGTPVIHEQAKRIIIKEESPDEMHMHREQIMAEVIDQEDNNEEDFENAYKNAAVGFGAYEKKALDFEKDIYNPASYGKPPQGFYRENENPFEQYQAAGDTFPKSARLRYSDDRDDNKENYYLDYSVHKPESMSDRLKNKANYYKLYKSHKPEKYFTDNQVKKKEKYTLAPSFDYNPAPKQKSNGYFAQYKSQPVKYEYDYSKGTPRDRDNSAHASRLYQRLKSRTHFVEPQFQYGFEPIALPRLLDSELAAMASNNSPESEKPGMRKKIYQENWYIKKTSTAGGKPS